MTAPDLRTAAMAVSTTWDATWGKVGVVELEHAMDPVIEALRVAALAAEATEPPPDDERVLSEARRLMRSALSVADTATEGSPSHELLGQLYGDLCDLLVPEAGPAPDPQGADEPLFMGAVSLPGGGVPDEPGDDDLPTTAAVLASLEDIERFHDDADAQTAAGVARLALIGYRDRYVSLLAEVERLRAKPSQYDEATADNVIALTRTIGRQQAELDALRAAAPASEDDEPLRDVRSELYAITGRLIRFEWLATDIDLDDRTHGNVIRLGQRLRAVVDSLRPTMVRRPTTTPDNEQVAALLARADEWAATIHPELPAPRSLVSDLADALRAAGSPPPTPTPTREQTVSAIKASYLARQPFDFGHAADAVMALLSEPAPPLWTGVTMEPGDDTYSTLTLYALPGPPGTAVEVREKRP